MSDTVLNALALRSFIDLWRAQDGEGFGRRLACVPVAERHYNVTQQQAKYRAFSVIS
ncbi:hypothetical protein [Streptomyces sioyaensis]|uniref:hypothetical protein n=1 Tax=Streptomyces sioyaensis TaxID=67364 RepID=UPI0037BB2374